MTEVEKTVIIKVPVQKMENKLYYVYLIEREG